jgi:hypothetical protein
MYSFFSTSGRARLQPLESAYVVAQCETLPYAYHSFLTIGFSQRELRLGAGGGAGTL